MAVTRVEGTVTGPAGQTCRVDFLVDSGAVYSLPPDDVWRAIGLSQKRAMRFRLADGTPVERQVSECHIALGREPQPMQILPM